MPCGTVLKARVDDAVDSLSVQESGERPVFPVIQCSREALLGLHIFDMDGTLISSYMDAPGKRYASWEVLPGRAEALRALREQGHWIAVATNQAGVAFGHVTESQVTRKIAAVVAALGLPVETSVAVCFAHAQAKAYRYNNPRAVARRKPSGTMLREIMEETGIRDDVTYVGDKPEDRAAARDASISFRQADDFFASFDLAPDGAEGVAPLLGPKENETDGRK